MKKVLLKDIAKLACVSQMTVSRVINTPEKVHPDTRQSVEDAMNRLNYRSNAVTQTSMAEKSRNIRLLVIYDAHNFPNTFLPLFLRGIHEVIARNNYNLILHFDKHDGRNRIINESEWTNANSDGFLILSVDSNAEALSQLSHKLQESNTPVVIVNQVIDTQDTSYVSCDDFGGGFKATSYLINKGHRNIGIISGSEQYSTSSDRFKGFLSALDEHGISFNQASHVEGHYTKEGGYEAMGKLHRNLPNMTAVFCTSDLMALGAMKYCLDKNIRIPDDISIIGYDDMDFTSMLNPALTTVRKDRERMGKDAAEILLNLINGYNKPIQLKLDTEVIERESVKRHKTFNQKEDTICYQQ